MNRFEKAQLHMNKRMQDYTGLESITYHAGIVSVVLTGKAWLGSTAFRIQDHNGSRVVWQDFDLLIPVVDLKDDDGNQIIPKKGHWVEYTPLSGNTGQFEISAPQGEQEVRYSDAEQSCYRLHCKFMKRT